MTSFFLKIIFIIFFVYNDTATYSHQKNFFVAQTLEMTDQLDAQAWEWCNSLVFSIIINIIIINIFNTIITITKPPNPS